MSADQNPAGVPAVTETRPTSSQAHRYLHAIVFVGIWMAAGWIFHLDANSYLLIGVPLTVAFQIFIRRKPLVTLWVRDATRFQLSLLGIVVGIVLAILPSIGLIDSFKSSSWRTHLPETLWLLCAVGGAFGAGFSSGYFTKETWKSLGLCLATAGAIGCGLMASAFLVKALVQKAPLSLSWSQARVGVASFLTYVPICFVLEEVTFRGAIDAHVHQPGDRYPWLSALIVSCLWGLWHVPIVGGKTIASVVALVILMPLVHSLIGVFLSFSWRRSGNLAVPALVHAFIDGVRNMLLK